MLHGLKVDSESRCLHYSSALDIIAIQFPCCKKFYACRACHDSCESHPAKVWEKEALDQLVILCGHCKKTLTAREYFTCNHACPHCQAPFNPGCASHHHLYFTEECSNFLL